MSPQALTFSASVGPPTSGPRVRIAAALVVRNSAGEVQYVPDPHRGTRTLVLHLRLPSGQLRSHVIGDEPSRPGVRLLPIKRAIPGGGEVTFEVDVTRYFEILTGRHSLELEYRFAEGEAWRSPALEFERVAPAGTYLTVMAAEAAGYGYHAVLWLERSSQRLRAVLFDDDGKRRDIEDAQIVADDMPPIADAAMSQYPAGLPYTEYWLAWIADERLCIRFYAHGDPDLTLPQWQHPLPAEFSAIRLIHPLMADQIPHEGRPPCTVGMLAVDQHGPEVLSIVRLTPDGRIAASAATVLPGRPVGAWAISPRADERLFVLALETADGLQIVAFPSDAEMLLGAMRVWHTEGPGTLLAGDVRADLEGRTFVGLVVASGSTQMRVTFVVPAAAASSPLRDPVSIPATARILCARLDSAGRLHLAHSSPAAAAQMDTLVYHVAPAEPAASSNIQRAGLEPWSVRLIVRPNSRPLLVGYDAHTGPFLQRI